MCTMFKLIKVKLLYLRSDFITLKSVEGLAVLLVGVYAYVGLDVGVFL